VTAEDQRVQIGSVEFRGGFQPAEREFLAGQFSQCRFELLARSVYDSRLALVAWQTGGGDSGAGPRPLRSAPARAVYVLDGNVLAEAAAAPGTARGRQARQAGALIRVDSSRELEARHPGHFPGARVDVSFWERLRRAVRGAMPIAIVVVLTIWVAIVISLLRAG
jgi:hypothetical protein